MKGYEQVPAEPGRPSDHATDATIGTYSDADLSPIELLVSTTRSSRTKRNSNTLNLKERRDLYDGTAQVVGGCVGGGWDLGSNGTPCSGRRSGRRSHRRCRGPTADTTASSAYGTPHQLWAA